MLLYHFSHNLLNIFCNLQGTSEEVAVFVFDIKNGNDTQLEVARAAVKRLKTLRHPSILTYLDSLEVLIILKLLNFPDLLVE